MDPTVRTLLWTLPYHRAVDPCERGVRMYMPWVWAKGAWTLQRRYAEKNRRSYAGGGAAPRAGACAAVRPAARLQLQRTWPVGAGMGCWPRRPAVPQHSASPGSGAGRRRTRVPVPAERRACAVEQAAGRARRRRRRRRNRMASDAHTARARCAGRPAHCGDGHQDVRLHRRAAVPRRRRGRRPRAYAARHEGMAGDARGRP